MTGPDDTTPLLSIIVVSYNTREMTLECLRSVYAETTLPFELIVIDNASEDGSAEAIAAEFPQARMMAETVNHGFALANNVAAKQARGEYVLLLNPDTLVLDAALDRLHAFAQTRPKAGIWGGRTVFADHSLNPYSVWQRMTIWNIFCRTAGLARFFRNSPLFNAEAYGGWDRSDVREVDIVTGCLFLIRRADWETLGGFDTTYIMYGEEADLCLRARDQLDARPTMTPDSTIVHYGGASEKVLSDKMVRLLKAKSELIKRHFPSWQRPVARALFLAWPFSRSLFARLVGRSGTSSWPDIWARRNEWRNGFS